MDATVYDALKNISYHESKRIKVSLQGVDGWGEGVGQLSLTFKICGGGRGTFVASHFVESGDRSTKVVSSFNLITRDALSNINGSSRWIYILFAKRVSSNKPITFWGSKVYLIILQNMSTVYRNCEKVSRELSIHKTLKVLDINFNISTT